MAWSFVEESIDQPALTGAIESGRFSCWRPPVNRPITDPFRPPPCRWCSGNRGLEFAAQSGDDVLSVVSGTVWFTALSASRVTSPSSSKGVQLLFLSPLVELRLIAVVCAGRTLLQVNSSALPGGQFTSVFDLGEPTLILSYGCGRGVVGLVLFPSRHLVGRRSQGHRVRLMCPVIFRPLADSVSDGLPTGEHPSIRVTRDTTCSRHLRSFRRPDVNLTATHIGDFHGSHQHASDD